jgi:hypothetical protein
MKRYFLTLCVSALLCPALAQAQEPAKQPEPAKKFTVPFELIKTQHMVISVKFNGKGPYRLVFDTGAPDSLVSNKVAKEAGLLKDAKAPPLALFGSRGQVKIKEIEIGGLKAENISTMVLDHPTVQAISSFVGPIEGIIGFTFYARYNMTIDYEKKLMTFEPNNYKPGDVMDVMMKTMMAPKAVRETPRILSPAGLIGIRVEKAKDDEAAGVTVKDVLAGSAAAKAGVKSGDRLLTLDGRWTDTVADLYFASGLIVLDRPVAAQVLRDGKKLELKLTVRPGL